MRWSRENDFDTIVAAEAAAQGVPAELIKATIGAESAFVPAARRFEPKLNDASYGLMQVLYRTAIALGYSGTPEGLFDPATNIHYGTALLAQNLNTTGGDIPRAVSAYNGGFRESLGFGKQLPNGQFGNQPYVTRVLMNLKYFREQAQQQAQGSVQPQSGGGAAPVMAAVTTAAGGKVGLLLAALLAAVLLYLRTRR